MESWYIDLQLPQVQEEINSYLEFVDNKVIKIKLKEVGVQVENFMKGSLVEDKHILMLMRYYQLLKELKNMRWLLNLTIQIIIVVMIF